MGKIKRCCGKMISLTINHGKFQISNFYRHLQGSRSGITCRKIKELIKNQQLPVVNIINNQQSSSVSTAATDPTLSSNFVPSTTEPVTMSSNSTNSLSSSITISVHDRGLNEK
ncbi:unnamed protein product [Rotaria sordida]|uniref:Uncharacterized protein n=1 Tax=Rotaria sordida TaxID=392033 RepID=A0A818SVF0_9BILA|nr:unnamed protein product [Rotaria sordida]CAF1475750.1 unnamed protein product [Rotaria sordida]CAF3678000.1 unnamed protein product [Rotaria sordida]CAF3916448.1 unnamed protein product [Rotaria sordida]